MALLLRISRTENVCMYVCVCVCVCVCVYASTCGLGAYKNQPGFFPQDKLGFGTKP
jgi:hypothetical protein